MTSSGIWIAAGDLLAAGTGVWLVLKLAGGPRMLERPRHVGIFALIAAGVSAPIHATSILVAEALGGRPEGVTGPAWAGAWANALAAILTIAPAFVAFARWRSRLRRENWQRRRRPGTSPAWLSWQALERVALVATAGAAAFWFDRSAFLVFPLLAWAAVRFGPQETGLVAMLIAGGIYAAKFHAMAIAVTSLTAFMLAAAVEYRSQHQTRLRQLAVTDPLTGLANFRHLADSIERNIARSRLSRAPFAVMLLDVDYLKAINDRDGHAAGSRLLIRLAGHLRESFRSTDLLARHGGDEFAVVLPGCDAAAAEVQAERIRARLRADQETPRLSVSLGIAVFPTDGETTEVLLEKADQGLYAAKAQRGTFSRVG